MSNNIKADLFNLIKVRTAMVSDHILPRKDSYGLALERLTDIIGLINAALSVDNHNLIELYEEALTELQDINDDMMYLQGLKDGVALARILEIDKEVELPYDHTQGL